MEAVLVGQSSAKGDHFVAGEFEDSAASMANHVIVGVFAESQLVVRLFDVESNLFEDSAFDQQGKRAIDGRLGDAVASSPQGEQELLRLEMVLHLEHGFEGSLSGFGELDAAAFEVASEGFGRGFGAGGGIRADHAR